MQGNSPATSALYRYIYHITSSLVVMSHKNHACSVFAVQAYRCANELNAKDRDETSLPCAGEMPYSISSMGHCVMDYNLAV